MCVCPGGGSRCEKDKKKKQSFIDSPSSCPLTVLWVAVITFLRQDSLKKKKFSVLYSRYWRNKYITATHDRTAVREKEGMSEGRRKKGEGERERETLIHFSWLLAAAGQEGEGER